MKIIDSILHFIINFLIRLRLSIVEKTITLDRESKPIKLAVSRKHLVSTQPRDANGRFKKGVSNGKSKKRNKKETSKKNSKEINIIAPE